MRFGWVTNVRTTQLNPKNATTSLETIPLNEIKAINMHSIHTKPAPVYLGEEK
jgi:hypothetical protein